MNNLLLIDGHSILNRAFYGIPMLTNHEGIHTNAIYGFINIMLRAIEDEKSDHIAVAFDLKAPTFRHKMYEMYKGTRKPMPAELHEQVPVIKEILASMNIPVITLEGYEADDILGTVGKKAQSLGYNVVILSGDRDLLQLADEHIKIRLPKTIKGRTEIENYYPEDVMEKYMATPSEFIDLKALMGDSSDNIPGVPGIGEKTAMSIISKYHSIENAYEHVEELTPAKAKNSLRENYDLAKLSKVLATIETDAPVEFNIEDSAIGNIFTKEAYELFTRYELKSLLKYFDKSSFEQKEIPEEIIIIKDYFEVDKVFEACRVKGKCGISIAKGDVFAGVAICYKPDSVTFISCEGLITEEYLVSKIKELDCEIYTINLKNHLEYFTDSYKDKIHDIAIMAYLLNPLLQEYEYNDIANDFMGITVEGRSDIIGKNKVSSYLTDGFDKIVKLFALEAYVAFNSFDEAMKMLRETDMEKVYHDIELPVIYVLKSMEKYGIAVNKDALKQYGDELSVKIKDLEQSIYKEAGTEFNINSPKQLGEVLFEKLNLPCGKKTKTGYSTSADVLEKLSADYPIVDSILEYRTLAKLKSTYADGLAEYIVDGRIHSTFNQTITATGRISSTEPNLQNIPIRMELGRKIRKVFVPEDGFIFMDADYSQIELRLLAHMSGDDTLIEAYNEDRDIHKITASKVFKTPLDEVTPRQRSNAKAVNFGIVYGISSFGLSRDLSISKKEAKEYIDEYFNTYKTLKNYLDNLVKSAKENGYTKTIYGRRRPVPELSSGNFMQRQFGERIAMNSPLQGTAADIIKIAMINVYKRLKNERLESRLILQIHDELLIETKIGEEEQVRKILSEEMVNAATLRVPLAIDIHSGKDWYEAK